MGVHKRGKFIATENKTKVTRGWEERGMGHCLMGAEFLFEMRKRFWRWRVGTVARESGSTQRHQIAYLKRTTVLAMMLCIFYHHSESVQIRPAAYPFMYPCSHTVGGWCFPSSPPTQQPHLAAGGQSPHQSQAPVYFPTPDAPSPSSAPPTPKRRG